MEGHFYKKVFIKDFLICNTCVINDESVSYWCFLLKFIAESKIWTASLCVLAGLYPASDTLVV